MTPRTKSFCLILITFCVVLIGYLPNLQGPFFIIDDSALIDIPQLKLPFSIQLFKTLISPGYHVDFYPLRDLSYWFDLHILGKNIDSPDPFLFRLHNLAIFLMIGWGLYQFLRKIIQQRTTVLFMTCLWMINPVHYELVWWVSSRKDLLAIFFFILSALTWIHYTKKQQVFFSILSLFFFVCSNLSKTSFLLFPVALLAISFTKPYFSWRTRTPLIVASAFSLWWGALQNWQYSVVNDMRFFYSFDYRLSAAIAGLGRECLSVFFWGWSAVDLFNWGEWVQLNTKFVTPGLVFLALFLLFAWLGRKKQSSRVLVFLLLAAYLPTSGLLFPHRNFYSARYFESPLLVIWVGISIWLAGLKPSHNRRAWISLGTALFVFYSFGLLKESESWDSNRAILEKSLGLTPNNPALGTAHLAELINLNGQKRLDGNELLLPTALDADIKKQCFVKLDQEPEENGTLCTVYLRHVLDLMEKNKKDIDRNRWSQINNWLLKFEAMRTKQTMHEMMKRNWVKRVIILGERSPAPEAEAGYFTKEDQRKRWLEAKRLIDPTDSEIYQIQTEWIKRGLLRKDFDLRKSISSEN